ncbi:MAG: alkaline phosphatase [Bryobacterales bacterium]|nr:alkaline phosphatase [Bryobacterales bacterium]
MRISFVLLALCLFGCGTSTEPKRARNVILVLADAGGVATVQAASIQAHGAPLKLFLQSTPHVALMDTTTASKWVSDSAAGMTAIVTGQKTHNGVISQGPDTVRGEKDGTPLKTILEYAEELGLSTGVVSTQNIADATPAACYAHANNRSKFGEIFLEIFSPRFGDGVDIVFGVGRQRIFDAVRELGQDLEAIAKEKGRPIFASLSEVPADAQRAIAVQDDPIDFVEATRVALRALSRNPKGYFLMVECDAHTTNLEAGLDRLIRCDNLMREVSGLVNMDETLLLFTADHSFDLRIRGGGPDEPLLAGWEKWKKENEGKRVETIRIPAVRVDNGHTAEEVPLTAFGPGAELVKGYLPNTRVFDIMMEAYGWKP